MKSKLAQLQACNTIEDLENLKIGSLIYDIGYRGGKLGFYASDVINWIQNGLEPADLPGKYGVYCNYLGGGIRGSVTGSGYNRNVSEKASELLNALAEACSRAYIHAENGLNDEEYPDGETNWDAIATNRARLAGVVSAY